jgi:CRP/FNR family transcriptional regulator, cyclic AMP receptor protein
MTPHLPPEPAAARPVVRRVPRRGRLINNRVALVDVLGDASDDLTPERLDIARRAVHARVLAVRRGHWDAATDATSPGVYGFIVIEGTMIRRVTAGHREGAELLGAGDVLQPGRDTDAVAWRAVTDCRLAILDLRVLADAGQLPELAAALLAAANARTNTVARQLVVAQWPSVDERLVATLEMLAERWGVMTADGIVLPDFLTHSMLAPLVGARRPSVTTSLKRLNATGAVRRRPDGRWILARLASVSLADAGAA